MRILLVEDEKKIASFIARTLRENAYVVDVVETGEKALGLGLGRDVSYLVIILDVRLPGISGIDVCRELRQRGVEAPVMMLTARTLVEQRVEGLDTGADDYLTSLLCWSSFWRVSGHWCAGAFTKGMPAFATRTCSWIATTGAPPARKESFR